MAFPQYNSCRPQTPLTHVTLDIVLGGATTIAHNGNAYIQFENRAGRNLLSQPIPFSIPAGNKAVFTFADGIIESGEEVFWIVISIEDTGNSQDAIIIAKIAVINSDQLTPKTFPIVVELSRNDHFASLSVASYSQLPSTDFLLGQIIFVSGEANYYIYDEWANDWLLYPEGRNAYLSSTTADKGCDRILTDATDALRTPTKIGNADTIPLKLWWRNGFNADGLSPVPANTRLTIDISINGSSVSADGKNYSTIFANKIKATLTGYVDTTTGILDTSQAQGQIIWNPVTNYLVLPEDLPRGYAAAWELILSFDNETMMGVLPSGASIDINLVEISENIGTPSPIATTIGDLIFAEGDRLRIVPTPMRLSGSASVKSGYLISSHQELPFSGLLAADTANQRVTLLGSLNGFIQVRQPGEQLLPDEIVRAIVSTEPGKGQIATRANLFVPANSGLNVTVTHPTAIRADYPDVIAGNDKALYTPFVGRIGISYGINFYEENITRSLGTAGSINFTITDLSNFTITSLHSPDADFDLFRSELIEVTALPGAGSFDGNYIVYFWAEYESPNTNITRLSHDPANGAVRELEESLAEIKGGDPYLIVNSSGDLPVVDGFDAIAIGENVNVEGNEAIGIGASSFVPGEASISLGSYSAAYGDFSVCVGAGSFADEYGSVALGQYAYSAKFGSVAIGEYAEAEGEYSIAIGSGVRVRDSATNSIAIGESALVGENVINSVQLGIGENINSNTLQFKASTIASDSGIVIPVDSIDPQVSALAGTKGNLLFNETNKLLYLNTAEGINWTALNQKQVYEVADIAARDTITGQAIADIAKVADDGIGNPKDFVWNGSAWIAFVGSSSGGGSGGSSPFAQDIGDGTNSILAINHNLGSRDIFVSVYRNSAPFDEVEVGIERTDINNISLDFGTTIPTTGEYRVSISNFTATPTAFSQDVGDGTNSILAINHNLGSRDIFISVYRNSAPFDEVEVGVEKTDINNINLDFGATVPSTNEYRVVVNS